MFMKRSLRGVAAFASLGMAVGCGYLSDSGSGDKGPIVVGTTSAPSTLDPAGSWDGSWELFRNVYQTLLAYPNGATAPEPDAAKSCSFNADHRVYSCELREGLKFSNGAKVDAEAVKHSVDRILAINAQTGPAGLLGSLDKVETKGDREVVFRLNKPDATFPFVLATPALSLVPPAVYPDNSLRKDSRVIGSGPYRLESYEQGKEAVLVRNTSYKGLAKPKNDAVTIRYFQDSARMVKSLRDGGIDLTYQGLAADDAISLQGKSDQNKGLELYEGAGSGINYLVFNPKDSAAGNAAVRKAVAQTIDRAAIAHKVYQDTVEPLYSMVPQGLTGHTTPYFDVFGEPDPAKAKKILDKAGVPTPVPLTLWYTTDRYGSDTGLEFKEIKAQLDGSGLFRVTLNSRPWNTYVRGYEKGEYPVFGRGWQPDFPDPDNFIAPFVGQQNALGTPYSVKEITDVLLPRSREQSNRGDVVKDFQAAQRILVEDVRLLPLWQGKQYIAASEEVGGAERSLDPATIMMVWELSWKTSW
ncbi:MAG TPA: ABC transporter substrate-binding protein [Streptomyces sp.]